MHIIIPARYASTRLPGKPLLDVAGKPLIERVYERARASGAASVTIATDDERIRAAAESFGARVVMTSASHRSGTDRIGEAISRLGFGPQEIVVNLQGDEPLMSATLLHQVAQALVDDPETTVATACHRLHSADDFRNPNVVKVVRDARGRALYFSRAPVPFPRDNVGPVDAFRHIGLYAYRAGFVARYCTWPPCALEAIEQLEQLRVLWQGERINVVEATEMPEAGVDTPDDLERVRRIYENEQD
jgi:3-deoxy-manno-octulosonate cytidylyltransferase (CMP-KDO synthetase)